MSLQLYLQSYCFFFIQINYFFCLMAFDIYLFLKNYFLVIHSFSNLIANTLQWLWHYGVLKNVSRDKNEMRWQVHIRKKRKKSDTLPHQNSTHFFFFFSILQPHSELIFKTRKRAGVFSSRWRKIYCFTNRGRSPVVKPALKFRALFVALPATHELTLSKIPKSHVRTFLETISRLLTIETLLLVIQPGTWFTDIGRRSLNFTILLVLQDEPKYSAQFSVAHCSYSPVYVYYYHTW